MTTPSATPFRRIALPLIALACGAAGWWLHGFCGQKSTAAGRPQAGENQALSTVAAPPTSARLPATPSASVPGATPAEIQRRADAVVERMSTTYSSDMIEMLDAIGALTQLSDAEVRAAWNELAQRTPTHSFGNGLTALYLWGRMSRLGEKVSVPAGWGAENFGEAIASEQARHNQTNTLARLKAGETLSDTERRIAFTTALREDPVAAIKLWCSTTKPADYGRDVKWLGDTLTNPETRDAIMAQLRQWQTSKDLGDTVVNLAQQWITRDSAAVEQWLKQPQQADVRDAVLGSLIGVRTTANPEEAWKWSQSLPEAQRLEALGLSANQLANRGPEGVETGMKLIAELKNPDERREAVRGFANILAANDYKQWLQWRDALPETERDYANESAFALWVNQDIGNAVQWLNTLPAGERKDRGVTTMVFYFAEKDPHTAAQWIRTISDPDRRRDAVVAALSNVGPENLDRVQTLLGALNN